MAAAFAAATTSPATFPAAAATTSAVIGLGLDNIALGVDIDDGKRLHGSSVSDDDDLIITAVQIILLGIGKNTILLHRKIILGRKIIIADLLAIHTDDVDISFLHKDGIRNHLDRGGGIGPQTTTKAPAFA